ncbi:Flowering locus K homology domain [Bienertia sinuspersici]
MAQQGQYPPIQPTLQPYSQHHQYPPPPPHPSSHHHQQQPPLNLSHQYAHQFHHHHHHPHQYASLPQLQPMPLPPIQYPTYPQPHPQPHYSDRPSSKRPREPVSDAAFETPSTKRQAVGSDILFRVVVPSGQIGKVIGKGGHRVQKIREDTTATIKIADPIARYEERVIIISSKENDTGGISDAEKALLQIATLILADDGSSAPAVSIAAATDPYGVAAGLSAGHVAVNSVKLLIAGSQAGGLIGYQVRTSKSLETLLVLQ